MDKRALDVIFGIEFAIIPDESELQFLRWVKSAKSQMTEVGVGMVTGNTDVLAGVLRMKVEGTCKLRGGLSIVAYVPSTGERLDSRFVAVPEGGAGCSLMTPDVFEKDLSAMTSAQMQERSLGLLRITFHDAMDEFSAVSHPGALAELATIARASGDIRSIPTPWRSNVESAFRLLPPGTQGAKAPAIEWTAILLRHVGRPLPRKQDQFEPTVRLVQLHMRRGPSLTELMNLVSAAAKAAPDADLATLIPLRDEQREDAFEGLSFERREDAFEGVSFDEE